jgi:hypothetical protein
MIIRGVLTYQSRSERTKFGHSFVLPSLQRVAGRVALSFPSSLSRSLKCARALSLSLPLPSPLRKVIPLPLSHTHTWCLSLPLSSPSLSLSLLPPSLYVMSPVKRANCQAHKQFTAREPNLIISTTPGYVCRGVHEVRYHVISHLQRSAPPPVPRISAPSGTPSPMLLEVRLPRP